MHDDVEVEISGYEARYYVRAGQDPACATEQALTALIDQIMSGRVTIPAPDGGVRYEHLPPHFDRQVRSRLAVAAIQGWATRTDADVRPPVWHRLLGRDTVTVGLA